MKRYKSAFTWTCQNNHINLYEDRVLAESKEQAIKIAGGSLYGATCMSCASKPITTRWLGTEEISLHPVYWCFGYVCKCGERVEVLRAEEGISINPPSSKTVSCSQDHVRTIQNREFPTLERWEEQTN